MSTRWCPFLYTCQALLAFAAGRFKRPYDNEPAVAYTFLLSTLTQTTVLSRGSGDGTMLCRCSWSTAEEGCCNLLCAFFANKKAFGFLTARQATSNTAAATRIGNVAYCETIYMQQTLFH
jgi:hypothetical protein